MTPVVAEADAGGRMSRNPVSLRRRRSDSSWVGEGGHPERQFSRLVQQDLIPAIDAAYPSEIEAGGGGSAGT